MVCLVFPSYAAIPSEASSNESIYSDGVDSVEKSTFFTKNGDLFKVLLLMIINNPC